jgi:flagella basal body P-ring formation protein FlgA
MIAGRALTMLRISLLVAGAVLLPFAAAAAPPAQQAITADAIALELKRELGDQLPSGMIQLALDNPGVRLFAPADAAPGVAVDNLNYDARSGRLTAYVTATAGAADAEPVRVTGRVYRMIELPVLARQVAPGDAITDRDVDIISVRSDRLTQDFVGAASDLVGKTPRHSIRPGEPVRASDVQVPILIRKGELVTLVLQAPGLVLTAQGKALDDGALGAAIRVSNTRSGRTLDASVVSRGTAAVITASAIAAR